MSKIINIVNKNNELVASISSENVILHNDYKVIETNEEDEVYEEVEFYYDGNNEKIRVENSI